MEALINNILDETRKLGFSVLDAPVKQRDDVKPNNFRDPNSIRFDITVLDLNYPEVLVNVGKIPYYYTSTVLSELQIRVVLQIPNSEMANLKEFQYLKLSNQLLVGEIKDGTFHVRL